MTRTLELSEETYEALRAQAAAEGLHPADLIARWLARGPGEAAPADVDPLATLVGTLTCTVTDVAKRHDHYLGQAVAGEIHRDHHFH